MASQSKPLLSVVVPVYNEFQGLAKFEAELTNIVDQVTDGRYEILYCDDGSTDQTAELVRGWHKANQRIKLIKLSRNFGKEYALSAGIAEASGQAILMLDGDGQHPVKLIPDFVKAWQSGNRVVVGVRTNSSGRHKSLSSKLFYKTFNKMTNLKLLPGSTDYRLIDASVQAAFLKLPERDRLTRGLIDWLGFEQHYLKFISPPRAEGTPTYGHRQRWQLAANSFVSLTPKPLYLFGYIGIVITVSALALGLTVFIEQLILEDPLNWRFSGTAMLAILLIFLVGLLLTSQAVLSLYISNIQSQSQRRPLYIIDYKYSAGINKPSDD